MAGQHSKRITLSVGQRLEIASGATIVFVRDNSNGTIVLDVNGQTPPKIDRERRQRIPLRRQPLPTR